MFEKALLKLKERDLTRAREFLTNCLKAQPEHAEAWMIAGNIEHAEGRFLSALLHHDRAVAIAPGKYDAWNNRGIALSDLGLFASARESFEKSIAILDAYEPRMNLAAMYCHLMDLTNAEQQYRAAYKTHVQDYEVAIQLGLALLGQGRWKEGFEHYEARLKNSPHPPPEERYPRWRGEDLEGKDIMLWPEQGIGDEIMMMRFAPEVKKRHPGVAHVILEVRPPMFAAAAAGLQGVDDIVVQHGYRRDVDYQCALTDLPMVFGTEPNTIPAAQGYFKFPGGGQPSWLAHTGAGKLKVGVCWNSGRRPLQPEVEASFKTKSIPLEWLAPLAQKGVQLYSLQKEHNDHQLMRKLGIIDYMPEIHSFIETAGLIDALDLVISVDTAVAHMAGAMGAPVWNFVRFSGYWPWMNETGLTAWYDSMRIYRQPQLGDWDEPIKRAASDLCELVAQKKQKQGAVAA